MNKYTLRSLIFLFSVLSLNCIQSGAYAQRKITGFELEADPLAYILKGYSLHAGITYGSFRTSMGTFAIQQPDMFSGNEAFSVYHSGFDLKTDYLFGRIAGWHSGLQISYAKEKVELKSDPDQQVIWGLNIGARVGYRWIFGNVATNYKGFYLNPWAALIYSPNAADIVAGKEKYKQKSFSIFPAVHVGWRF